MSRKEKLKYLLDLGARQFTKYGEAWYLGGESIGRDTDEAFENVRPKPVVGEQLQRLIQALEKARGARGLFHRAIGEIR